MKKVLLWILVILLLAAAACGGWWWYQETHIFVENAVYAKDSEVLDLRGTGISKEHFDTVHAQLPDCRILWDVPFQGKTLSSDTTAITLETLTEADLEMLSYFPDLNAVNALGCSEYAGAACPDLPQRGHRIRSISGRHPGCPRLHGTDFGSRSL